MADLDELSEKLDRILFNQAVLMSQLKQPAHDPTLSVEEKGKALALLAGQEQELLRKTYEAAQAIEKAAQQRGASPAGGLV